MTLRTSIMIAACAVGLAACNDTSLQQRAIDVALGEPNTGAAGQFPRFQPLLAAKRGQALEVIIEKNGIRGGFLEESQRGNIESWLGNDGVSLTFDRGVLHGTRGVGAGLLSSDVSASARAVLAGRTGQVERIHTFLNGNDEAVSRAYSCRITNEGRESIQLDIGAVSTRRMSENCRNVDQEFTNVYWVDPGRGRIMQSRQWAGEVLGELSIKTVFNY